VNCPLKLSLRADPQLTPPPQALDGQGSSEIKTRLAPAPFVYFSSTLLCRDLPSFGQEAADHLIEFRVPVVFIVIVPQAWDKLSVAAREAGERLLITLGVGIDTEMPQSSEHLYHHTPSPGEGLGWFGETAKPPDRAGAKDGTDRCRPQAFRP